MIRNLPGQPVYTSYREASEAETWPCEDNFVDGDSVDVILAVEPYVFTGTVALPSKYQFWVDIPEHGRLPFYYHHGTKQSKDPVSWWRRTPVPFAKNSPHTGKPSILAPNGGMTCERCKLRNEDAGPNQANGSYVCYNCRGW